MTTERKVTQLIPWGLIFKSTVWSIFWGLIGYFIGMANVLSVALL
jgi:hypothetical protein